MTNPYGRGHQLLRERVLAQEQWCPGYPVGIHDGAPVRTTQLDHKIPLARGGHTTRENVGGLCAGCNGRKALDDRVRTWRNR